MLKRFYSYHMIVSRELTIAKETSEFFKEKCINLCTYTTAMRRIRNEYKLWDRKWEPEIRGGVDWSPNHPDNLSARVIKDVWRLGRAGY